MGRPAEQEKPQSKDTEQKVRVPTYSLEANPLAYPVPFLDPESVDAIWYVVTKTLEELGAQFPQEKSIVVHEVASGNSKLPRLQFTFEVDGLITPEQFDRLREAAMKWYRGGNVDRELDKRMFPELHGKYVENKSKKIGFYFGPSTDVERSSVGLLIQREFSSLAAAKSLLHLGNDEEFLFETRFTDNMGNPQKRKTIIEIRAWPTQIGLMEQIIQVGLILNNQPIPDTLWLDLFDKLTSLGMKESVRDLPGTSEIKNWIETLLITPLANYRTEQGRISRGNSILLVGVPGTGKTELSKWTLREALRRKILPIMMTANDYQSDLASAGDPGKSKILHLVPRFRALSGRPVLLLVDDMELVGGKDNDAARTTMMNDLAGSGKGDYLLLGTTNDPKKMTSQVLNFERLVMIHCPLPGKEARQQILELQLPKQDEFGQELFPNATTFEQLIEATAEVTEDYDPRTLTAICSFALKVRNQRVMNELQTGDIRYINTFITPDDWAQAFRFVTERYSRRQIAADDNDLKSFVVRYNARPPAPIKTT